MLRWTFGQGSLALTCSVNAGDHGSYDVSLVPHWNLAASVIDECPSIATALERHAEIALALRSQGWVVVDRAR